MCGSEFARLTVYGWYVQSWWKLHGSGLDFLVAARKVNSYFHAVMQDPNDICIRLLAFPVQQYLLCGLTRPGQVKRTKAAHDLVPCL